ncbi:MAG: AAA family ATPase [Methanomassiliicoccaceae archaeon]|nr:AAA family ATPase [Methanomassiliicoccaceae archaeon]
MEEDPAMLYEKWFSNLDDWQKDLFNRLMDEDLTEDEQRSYFKTYIDSGPLRTDRPQISFGVHSSSLKRLLGIYNIENVGKIKNPEGITFREDSNVCLLFGNNGCGKSTLINLLKNVCGSRDAKKVRSNVFEEPKSPSASISYLADEKRLFNWTPDAVCPDMVGLQFFDSNYYRVYEKTGAEILLEPKLLAVLGEMAISFNLFKSYIINEKSELKKSIVIPEIFKETNVHKLYTQATNTETLDEIKEQSKLSPEEESELESIVLSLSLSDPSASERDLESAISYLNGFSDIMENWFDQYSDEKRNDLIKLKEKCIAFELAVKRAEEEFGSTEFNGLGNDVWKALWEAAKDYSEKYAYPNIIFPNTEDGSRCVLCQQTLSNDAQKRFVSFEEYITSDVEKSLKKAQTELADVMPEPIWEWDCVSLQLLKNRVPESIIANIRIFYVRLFERSNEIRNEKNCERETKIFSLEQFNAVHEKVISELESKCRIFHEASVQRQVIEEKEKLLSSRKWFSQNEYVFDRKKKMIKLNNFNTDTHSTSVLKTNLSAILITDKFVEQFKKELESIRAKNLQVELKIATSKGSSAHSISLKNLNSSSKGLSFGEVLSEGERRAVSFAAFVAEIIVDFPQMPLVFDDPTNSMDNKYEAEIAKRIIELSKERQVIVFTHRITMSSLLHSIRGGQSFNCQRLMSEPVGLISSDVSFILGGAKSNVKTLIKEAEEIKKLSPKEMPSAKINLAIKIRRLLELMIEDVLFDGIVKRHNLNVGSMRLPRMLGVRDEDFTFVDEMMSRYSSDPHSQSAEAAYAEFDVQDMIDDLKKIKEQIDIIEKNKEDCASSLRVSTQL